YTRIPLTVFILHTSCHHRDLHSFPTRRSSDLGWRLRDRRAHGAGGHLSEPAFRLPPGGPCEWDGSDRPGLPDQRLRSRVAALLLDRKSTRLNSSHRTISYAVFCLKKKKKSI